MTLRARAQRAALCAALAVAGVAASSREGAPFRSNIDAGTIAQAIAIGQSRDGVARQRFHDDYVTRLDDPLLDRVEIVTEFRRVVLETEDRIRAGDLGWGPKQAADMLAPWRDKLTVNVYVTFPPDNLYRAMPRFDVVLYPPPGTAAASGVLRPLDVTETPRYGAAQPAPPGTPILAGTIRAIFPARTLDPRRVYLAGIGMEGRELRRVEIDFGRLQ